MVPTHMPSAQGALPRSRNHRLGVRQHFQPVALRSRENIWVCANRYVVVDTSLPVFLVLEHISWDSWSILLCFHITLQQ